MTDRPGFIDLFWSKVKRCDPDECWPWGAGRSGTGYGYVSRNGRNVRAHRVAFELTYGLIPNGLLVCHHCDNPLCCNPSHLFLGTQLDNLKDRDRKGRQASGDKSGLRVHPERAARGSRNGTHTHPEKVARGLMTGAYTHPEKLARGERNGAYTHPERVPRGERSGMAKLTEEKVREIRRLRDIGLKYSQISIKVGISIPEVGKIVRRLVWASVV